VSLERGGHHRLALAVGQGGHGAQHLTNGQPTLQVVIDHRAADLALGIERHIGGPRNPAGGTAQDLMQPAAQMADLGAGAEGDECVHEGLLDDVLGPPIGAESASHREQRGVVTGHDGGKGRLIAAASTLGQALVGLGIGTPFQDPPAHVR
jgi:hypothetical protein